MHARILVWIALNGVSLLGGVTGSVSAETAVAENLKEEGEHIRYTEEEGGASRLETAIVRLARPDGVVVDLIGAVHVADEAYYDLLNDRFRDYEAVLFELVGQPVPGQPLGEREPGRDLAWIGMLQEKMRQALELEGQLEGIDYSADNLVHADMSLVAFRTVQEQKGESFLSLWWKAMQAQLEGGDENRPLERQPGLIEILELLVRDDGADELKRLLGSQFDQIERLMDGIEADGGTVIVGERNKVALRVLEEQLQGGKRKLAVFYGAAHMPDLEQRLAADGFRRTGVEWLPAWDIPAPDAVDKDGLEPGADEG